jgi:hypothetical protein
MKLYMFRTVRLSIIRSLFTVHSAMVYVIQVCRQLVHIFPFSIRAHGVHSFWISRIFRLHLGWPTPHLPLSFCFSLKNALCYRVSIASAIDEDIRSTGWLIVRGGNRCLRRKTGSSVASFTTNPTLTGLLSNPELCNEKPATDLLNHDTLLCLEKCIFLEIFFIRLPVLRSSPVPRTLMFS